MSLHISVRNKLIRVVAAGLAVAIGQASLSMGYATAPAKASAGAKAQSHTFRSGPGDSVSSNMQDPDLTIGTLPNGLRYYLRVNKQPAKQAQMWLAVNAGSVLEDDDQQGFAHFLEHMAFNGTRHFPGNKLIDFIESAGMDFGADLNAYTGYSETVYQLTVPTHDPAIMSKGLLVLEDWASGAILMDEAEVTAERGVVLGEWRQRLADTSVQNAGRYQTAAFLGERYSARSPIGDPQLIATATPAPLQRFYKDWYRPDLMSVVIVGDFDKVAMEQEIRTRFGKIPKPVNPRTRDYFLPPQVSEPVVSIFRGAVNPGVTVFWKQPSPSKDLKVALRQQMIDHFLFDALNERYTKLSHEDRRPFLQANLGRGSLIKDVEGYQLSVSSSSDSLPKALTIAMGELERIAKHAFPEVVLQQRKTKLIRQLEGYADGASHLDSKEFASVYVTHFLSGEGWMTTSAQDLALLREILPTITPASISEAARFWRSQNNRKVMWSMPAWEHAAIPTTSFVNGIFDSVATFAFAADTASSLKSSGPLIATLPQSGHVVKTIQHQKSAITEWTLSNGARVLYKPTNFNSDEIMVRARSLGGYSLLPDSLLFSSGRLIGALMTAAEGLGNTDRDGLQQQLQTTLLRDFRVAINYTDEEILLNGSPKNLETLFQLMYLQFTAPKIDSATVAAWRRYGERTLYMSENDRTARGMSPNNRRIQTPDPGLVPGFNLQEAMAVYRDRFGDAGDFTFTIVGAASPEQIRPLVERYIASLPSSNSRVREKAPDPTTKPFVGILRQAEKDYRVLPQQSNTQLVFYGLFPSSPEQYLLERERLSTLMWVLNRRLRIELRERMGVTYGASVKNQFFFDPRLHYSSTVQFVAPPERMGDAIDSVFRHLDSVRRVPITAQELATAMTVVQSHQRSSLSNNAYWMTAITQFDQIGVPLDRIPELFRRRLTPEELRETAQRYLPKDNYIHVTTLPTDRSIEDLKKRTQADR